MKRLVLPILLAFLVLAPRLQADACSTAAGNLVTNCGFEMGDFTSWAFSGFQSSPAYLGVSHGVDSLDAHTGAYGAYVGGFGGVLNISQSIATTPGTDYQITYWLAQSPATLAPYVSSFATTFNGITLFSAGNAPNLSFTRYSFSTTALTAQSLLNFGARDDTGFFSLDDISVTPIATPEPATLTLLTAVAFLCICRFLTYASCSNAADHHLAKPWYLSTSLWFTIGNARRADP